MKKKLREGAIHDDFDDVENAAVSYSVNLVDVMKVAQVESESNYIYHPLKRNFRSLTRITTYVIVASRKFKKKMMLAKMKRGEKVSDGSTLKDLNFPPPKFISYSATSTNTTQMLQKSLKNWRISKKLEIELEISKKLEILSPKNWRSCLQ